MAAESTKHTAVFMLIDSPLNHHVNTVNTIIPVTKESIRLGHKLPSNPITACFVAVIYIHVTGIPSSINIHLYLLKELHNIGAFICIHAIDCAIEKNSTASTI
tara:strand:- start:1268 stop:1576 length:309 start_codon:yes stop_codon:yes gene_type:complete